MAKSKILFCRYKHPQVEALAEWNPKYEKQGENCMRVLNDTVVDENGEFDNEFFFLETKIKGSVAIITLSTKRHYATNDPTIVAKLETYLAAKYDDIDTSAKNRGRKGKNLGR